jgi:hypothetical protein
MKIFSILTVVLLLSISTLFSQIAINTDGSFPDNSAMLDVKAVNKGLLPPRVALNALNISNPVVSPATGLQVYNTAAAGISPNNVVPGNYFWNGSRWVLMSPPQGVHMGDMLCWNGTQWSCLPAGSNGQALTLNNGLPTWGGHQLPMISTAAVTSIHTATAVCGGNITHDGGTVYPRGVCWSTSPNPTTANNKTYDGTGSGSYTSTLAGLTANTLYYIRAYATNSTGTSYGEQVSFTTLQFDIGLSFGGGIIFYLDGSGQHGLIAATSDQATGVWWGCSGTLIGCTATAIGTGQANTTAIINGCSNLVTAASICQEIVLSGYSDWFLPSKDELNQMYLQRNVIGGFTGSGYWSSSEYNDSFARWQDFQTGSSNMNGKDIYFYHVRAIRVF